MISPIGSGGSLHLRRTYAQRSIVTTRSIALQLASSAPWQPVPASHARPRPNPGAHLSVASAWMPRRVFYRSLLEKACP